MASSPQSYQKRQRELRQKERKAEKLAIRHSKNASRADGPSGPTEDELLEEFRLLNEQFAKGSVSEEDFEYRKAELFAALGLGEPPAPRDEVAESDDD